MKTTCSSCDGPNKRHPQRYCHACHRREQRAYRKRLAAELRMLRTEFGRVIRNRFPIDHVKP